MEHRADVKAAVLDNALPAVGTQLVWSDGLYPSVANVELLPGMLCAGLGRMMPEVQRWLFHNERALTEVEHGMECCRALSGTKEVQGQCFQRQSWSVYPLRR